MLVLSQQRSQNIVDRIQALSEERVREILSQVEEDFGQRHKSIRETFLSHYQRVCSLLGMKQGASEERNLLIGAYLTMEYSVESTALFNPSIVQHPDQTGVRENQLRTIISLRAVGEGHISSIVFRNALIDEGNNVDIESRGQFPATARVIPDRHYDKHLFFLKLFDMTFSDNPSAIDNALRDAGQEIVQGITTRLNDRFTSRELMAVIQDNQAAAPGERHDLFEELERRMILLTRSNYEIHFDEDSALSERVIFPVSPSEANGIEDARFVRFVDDDGSCRYYATYTAYDGDHILTQLLETEDFRKFKVHTINGKFSQSKGMALFPRRIKGKYAMISRIDGEKLYLMYSDNPHFWGSAERLKIPMFYWELTQIGNCGSPIETEKGWLLLTHGVGPMRKYSIGVVLLDLKDPSKIIGQLSEPLLSPAQDEREGYVPNVVYSCGGLIHNNELIVPYAVSDTASRIASIPMDELLEALGAR